MGKKAAKPKEASAPAAKRTRMTAKGKESQGVQAPAPLAHAVVDVDKIDRGQLSAMVTALKYQADPFYSRPQKEEATMALEDMM